MRRASADAAEHYLCWTEAVDRLGHYSDDDTVGVIDAHSEVDVTATAADPPARDPELTALAELVELEDTLLQLEGNDATIDKFLCPGNRPSSFARYERLEEVLEPERVPRVDDDHGLVFGPGLGWDGQR